MKLGPRYEKVLELETKCSFLPPPTKTTRERVPQKLSDGICSRYLLFRIQRKLYKVPSENFSKNLFLVVYVGSLWESVPKAFFLSSQGFRLHIWLILCICFRRITISVYKVPDVRGLLAPLVAQIAQRQLVGKWHWVQFFLMTDKIDLLSDWTSLHQRMAVPGYKTLGWVIKGFFTFKENRACRPPGIDVMMDSEVVKKILSCNTPFVGRLLVFLTLLTTKNVKKHK